MTEDYYIECPYCDAKFKRSKEREYEKPLRFCAYCGAHLLPQTEAPASKLLMPSALSLVPPPKPEDAQQTIGQYQVVKSIGKGGMGEVFLAYDTICGRMIALKRIRRDLTEFPQIQKRFLREARITAQLTHPAIVPIYSIGSVDNLIYYSMPYVEGETLKAILRRARDTQKKEATIAYLMRQFLQVCQAVAYAHSKGVLHRDLKPENVIIGKYGQVLILDWGLAKVLGDEEELPLERIETRENHEITRLGKVVGTIAFMAPERAQGKPATVKTDIYSLGVMLYQLLTLELPFRRKNLKAFKRHWKKEQLTPPEIVAPYRDVPQVLSEAVKHCLAVDEAKRFSSVDQLIASIENYLEGKSEWVTVKTLDVNRKEDWQFQENIFLAEHLALTRVTESSGWVSVMISKESFAGKLKLEAKIRIGEKGRGIGLLFALPESAKLRHLSDGYCLWLASEQETAVTTKLLLSSVSVLEAPEIVLKSNEWHKIRVEKVDDQVSFYLNDVLRFSYVSHIPVVGNHVGLLARDADFEIQDLTVSVGSQNITVNCLAVPDAFLASKMYDKALSEYQRIGTSFIGRQEGREALFRAGMTLLQQAKDPEFAHSRLSLLDRALDEFGYLRNTPGAPLEYLGKSLVYHELGEYVEEAKCFELALRRYQKHPLLPILQDEILFRMHESSHQNRIAAYHFISLATRFLPSWAESPAATKLFSSLENNWEQPFFILHPHPDGDAELKRLHLSLGISFWLGKPFSIAETTEEILARPIVAMPFLADALFLLVVLGATDMAKEKLSRICQVLSVTEQERYQHSLELMRIALTNGMEWLQNLSSTKISPEEERLIWLLLRKALDASDEEASERIVRKIAKSDFHFPHQEAIDALITETLIFCQDFAHIEQILKRYSPVRLSQEESPLYFANGCYLVIREGAQAALQEFSKLLDIAFPRSWVLGAHFLAGKIHMTPAGWFARSFAWERRCLYQQLRLFWHAAKDQEKSLYWKTLLLKEE